MLMIMRSLTPSQTVAVVRSRPVLGNVHTGPVPNDAGPILERTISVHTAPFRLSTSGHTGPVCYGSILNRNRKSSCFYQLSMRRAHVEVFKMAPKKAKSTDDELSLP